MKKFLKRLSLAFLAFFIISISLLLGLLYTETGLRQLPRLLSLFTPYHLEANTWHGSLLGGLEADGLVFSGEGVELQLEQLRLKLDSKALWQKHVHLHELALVRGYLDLPASSEEPSPPSEPLHALPDIHLPMLVDVDHIHLEQFRISQQKQTIITLHDATLEAHYHGNDLTLQSALYSDLADIPTLKLALKTTQDYPLSAEVEAHLHEPKQALNLHATGSILNPQLTLHSTGDMAEVDAQIHANIDLAQQALKANLSWQNLSALGEYKSPQGTLSAQGTFDALQLELQTETLAQGQTIPPLTLAAKALLTPESAEHIDVQLKALAGTIGLEGKVQFSPLTWDNRLILEDINPEFFGIQGNINAKLHTTGTEQSALLQIEQLDGKLEGYPLHGTGSVRYEHNTLHADHLNIRMADNHLTANGIYSPEQAQIEAHIHAPKLQQLLPELKGALEGVLKLSGNPDSPALEANVAWKALHYGKLFESQNGSLQAQGTLQDLQLNAALDGKGQDIPSFKAKLQTKLYQFQELQNIQLSLNALEGKAELAGKVHLSPVAWDLNLTTDKLNPKALLPELSALLNSELHTTGQLEPQLQTTVNLKALSGSWQKQALSGQGVVKLEGDKVLLDGVQLKVGNNQLVAEGRLSESALDLGLKLDAKALSAFYPKLSGMLQIDGKITGKPQLPTVQLNAKGSQLQFNDFSVAQLSAKLHTHADGNGIFNNQLEAKGVNLDGKKWQSIQLHTNGTFNQHTIKLQTTGGESNLQTQIHGGFKGFDEYLGEIRALSLQHQGINLKTNRTAQLHYHPNGLTLQHFCLMDGHSDACVDVSQQQGLTIKYQIKALHPKSLGDLIPNEVKVQTVVRGQGEIRQNERGAWSGNSQIQLDNGSINVRLPDQPPLTIPITGNSGLNIQLNGQQLQSALRLNLGQMGLVEGNLNMNNFQRMNGSVRVNMPDLGVWRTFAPKISTLKGQVDGQMAIGGTLDNPEFQGNIALKKGLIVIPAYSTELKDISLQLLAQKTGQIDILGNIGTPEGNMKTQGVLHLSPLKLNLQLSGKDMLVANAKNMKVSINPTFDIQIDPNKGIHVNGEIVIPKASIDIPDTSSGVSRSDDVVIVGSQAPKKKAAPEASNSPFYANIGVKLGNSVYFKNRDVNLRLKGGIQLKMQPKEALSASGKIEVASGAYMLYGQELDIRRGSVTFTGNNIANPVVDVLALRQINDVEVGASVKGAVSRLKLTLTSNPAMPDSSILSYLMFGRAPDGAMDRDGLMNAAANMALGSVMPDLAGATGLDVLDVNLNGLKAGKNLTEDLYVGLKSDFFTSITEFIAKYHFNKRMRVEASASQNNKQVEFIYEYEKD
ncbi:MAG: translocation/assembly module TamB domain-containing protein [Cardiobacteriaceae bacterium]|nr:translocation/assembly module TamB domain-containing protein [Cardiobacteriaceae bacterium]